MINRSFIGASRTIGSIKLEASMVRLFAQAVGITDEIFLDDAAARTAGLPAVPMPPTFLFCLRSMADKDSTRFFREMGVRLERLLHGEQEIELDRPVYAGETLSFDSTIADIYEKADGKLSFVREKVVAVDEGRLPVGSLISTFVIRN
jgi:acyl dehydratase